MLEEANDVVENSKEELIYDIPEAYVQREIGLELVRQEYRRRKSKLNRK